MKIFRGPSTKPFDDVAHELVADIDSTKSGSFVRDSVVVLANVTKEPNERQAVAHIQFDSADVLALHRRLITGLTSRSNELEEMKRRMEVASQKLYALFNQMEGMDSEELLGTKVEEVRDVVGTLAGDLDNSVFSSSRSAA